MEKICKPAIWCMLPSAILLGMSCKEEPEEITVEVSSAEGNLCAEVAEVTCYNFFQCCQGRQLEEMLGVEITTTESTCRNDIALLCDRELAGVQYAQDNGRVTMLDDNINACLLEYMVGEEGCFPFVTEIWPKCRAPMFKGNQEEGEECLESFECVEDSYCSGDRVCRSFAGEHESCAAVPCAAAYYCGFDASINETGEICLPLKGAGEECADVYECAKGLACVQGEENGNICSALKEIGSSCDGDEICQSQNCLFGTCGDGTLCSSDASCAGTCSESGGACVEDADCGGTCSTNGGICVGDEDCGRCEISQAGCADDNDCPSTCVSSGLTCTDSTYCDQFIAGDTCQVDACVTDTCVSAETCEGASTCDGRVCADSYFTADYCTDNPFIGDMAD
jgi:hypothetical protein